MRLRHVMLPAVLTALTAGALLEEAYAYVFCRRGSKLLSRVLDTRGHGQDYYTQRDTTAAALRERAQEQWTIRSARGETLRGFYIPGAGEGRRVAFLVHGYRSEHAETAGMYYDFYAKRGFDLFCCDHTAHGESEGRFIGFSVLEAEDCLQWIDTLLARLGADVEIVLHGFSMGAATVLRMSDRLPPQVRFVIEDSGFSSAEVQLRGQLGPLYPVMRRLNSRIAKYDVADGDTRPALKRATVPILFVHGLEDKTVPYKNGPALYEMYEGEKACLFVPGAKHIESMFVDPGAYAAAVDGMISQYL